MNLVVTGGSGLIGSRFIKLLPPGAKVIENIDRTNNLDILDLPGMTQAVSSIKVDTLVHFAAFTNVNAAGQQNGNPEGSCYQINVIGTQNIIKLAQDLDCHLIHISTDYVFDGQSPPAGGYTEKDQPNPIEWYGKTKFEAEKLIFKSGLNWCIARTAYPFVASFPPKLDLVRRRLKQMKTNSLSPQFSDHLITPTFVDDLVKALFTLAQHQTSGLYHLVGSDSLTDFEISKTIAQVFGFRDLMIKTSSIEEYNRTADRPYQESMPMSNRKFEKRFGPHFSPFLDALKVMKSQGVDI